MALPPEPRAVCPAASVGLPTPRRKHLCMSLSRPREGSRAFVDWTSAAWPADQHAQCPPLLSRGSHAKPCTTLIGFEMRLPEASPACSHPAWTAVTPSVTTSRLQLAGSVGQRESFANEAKAAGLTPGPRLQRAICLRKCMSPDTRRGERREGTEAGIHSGKQLPTAGQRVPVDCEGCLSFSSPTFQVGRPGFHFRLFLDDTNGYVNEGEAVPKLEN